MQAFVDQDMCIGCGLCVDLEPSVFRMNEDERAQGYAVTTEETKENVAQAIDMCPVSAIEEREV